MKRTAVSLLSFIASFLLLDAAAQKVCPVDYQYQADIKVFVVKNEYQADLLVYKTDRSYDSALGDNKGVWYFTDRQYQADKKIFFTDREYQADLKIFFVNQPYRAKWNRASKKHLLY